MKIVAEIGCNHKGNFNIAKKMIKILSNYCGVDIVKFQKRDNHLLLGDKYNDDHPNPENSYAPTYGEHRDLLEFSVEQHQELKEYCEELGVEYSCSVWDVNSAKDIISLKPKIIKIPSAQNTNIKLLELIRDNFQGEIHISLGMTTNKEMSRILEILETKQNKLFLYHCTSDYPVKLENVNLYNLVPLHDGKLNKQIAGIGFSGHHIGYGIDNLCLAYDVDYLERHFTLNKNWKGTDHKASLEPYEMRRLVKNIKDSQAVLKYKDKEVLDCEQSQLLKLKYKET